MRLLGSLLLLLSCRAFAEEPQWRYAGRDWYVPAEVDQGSKQAVVVSLWNRWVAPEIRRHLMIVVRPAWPKPQGVEHAGWADPKGSAP